MTWLTKSCDVLFAAVSMLGLLIAGSGGALAATLPPGTFRTIYKFMPTGGTGSDGAVPLGGMAFREGALYGTTQAGGDYYGGTVFKFDLKTGYEQIIHSFGPVPTQFYSQHPNGNLLYHDGAIYGTIAGDGSYYFGSIYKIELATGLYTSLYDFPGSPDYEVVPVGGLTLHDGMLYGMTNRGGPTFSGTIFKLNLSTGVETTIYSFCPDQNARCPDGSYPMSGFSTDGKVLYGVTGGGGGLDGYGTVFKFDPATNTETVLHVFKLDTNGFQPVDPPIVYNNALYGVTTGDLGINYNSQVIYRIDLASGAYTVMYTFQRALHDPQLSFGGLTIEGTALYGTSVAGGASSVFAKTAGGGTIFRFDPATGAETVLKSFKENANRGPYGALTAHGGKLYGSSTGYNPGAGTLFKYIP